MNNFYVDFSKHNGKLVDKIGAPVVVDMNNDEHVKALNKRQAFLNKGIDHIRVDSEMKCNLRFTCACGQDISISAKCDVQFELDDSSIDIDPMELELDQYDKRCYKCGTEFELIINYDNDLILKPIK